MFACIFTGTEGWTKTGILSVIELMRAEILPSHSKITSLNGFHEGDSICKRYSDELEVARLGLITQFGKFGSNL